jgi:hypothetical protein
MFIELIVSRINTESEPDRRIARNRKKQGLEPITGSSLKHRYNLQTIREINRNLEKNIKEDNTVRSTDEETAF